MSGRLAGVLLLSIGLGSLGCPGSPLTRYYLLGDGPSAVASEPAATGIDVGVRSFEVDPPYDQDRIVYRVGRGGAEVGFYAYHRWAAPLARMLPQLVATRLAGATGLRSIEPAVPGRRYDAWLSGRVLSLEEIDHDAGQDVHVRIELSLELPDGSRLWSATARRVETIETRDVSAIVLGLNRVAAGAVDELRPQLAGALADARGRIEASPSRGAAHSW